MKKYTLILAILYKRVIAVKLFEKGGINANRLTSFCFTFISKLNNNLIIMDNASSHKSKMINEIISKSGNKLHYSFPYIGSVKFIIHYLTEILKCYIEIFIFVLLLYSKIKIINLVWIWS